MAELVQCMASQPLSSNPDDAANMTQEALSEMNLAAFKAISAAASSPGEPSRSRFEEMIGRYHQLTRFNREWGAREVDVRDVHGLPGGMQVYSGLRIFLIMRDALDSGEVTEEQLLQILKELNEERLADLEGGILTDLKEKVRQMRLEDPE